MTSGKTLDYATRRPRRSWKSVLLRLLVLPLAYVSLYIALRAAGVFHAYYSQGSWEIEGGTGIGMVDISLLPLALNEARFHNYVHWLPEPAGG